MPGIGASPRCLRAAKSRCESSLFWAAVRACFSAERAARCSFFGCTFAASPAARDVLPPSRNIPRSKISSATRPVL